MILVTLPTISPSTSGVLDHQYAPAADQLDEALHESLVDCKGCIDLVISSLAAGILSALMADMT
jgi:hypothetical protein